MMSHIFQNSGDSGEAINAKYGASKTAPSSRRLYGTKKQLHEDGCHEGKEIVEEVLRHTLARHMPGYCGHGSTKVTSKSSQPEQFFLPGNVCGTISIRQNLLPTRMLRAYSVVQ